MDLLHTHDFLSSIGHFENWFIELYNLPNAAHFIIQYFKITSLIFITSNLIRKVFKY